ncbi:hypothetical protein U9M48_002083 [Paspalum notatum var. saurae]|uniref:Uncharacterized protein n=1 Tax=Paspalum notatum var. saurae TaxID=547442 RepID=A0AAQ3SDA4_PASNO
MCYTITDGMLLSDGIQSSSSVSADSKDLSVQKVIQFAARLLSSWAILQREDLQDLVVVGSQLLVRAATAFFSQAHGWRSSLRIDYS